MIEPNSEYWTEYYRVVDVGCGNGRDTLFFAHSGFQTTGVDSADIKRQPLFNIEWLRRDALDASLVGCVYARWLLHVLMPERQAAFLEQCREEADIVFLEFRTELPSDIGHYRRAIGVAEVTDALAGWDILYARQSRGWSVLGSDDPLLGRVIACRDSRRK